MVTAESEADLISSDPALVLLLEAELRTQPGRDAHKVYVQIGDTTLSAPENGLAKLTRHAVPSVLAGTAILENTLGHLSQAEGIVKLPVGEQPGIRGDPGTVEFKLQSTVKNDPKAPLF